MARHPAIAFFSKKEPNFFREADPDACRAAIAAAGPPPEAPWLLDASVDYARQPLHPTPPANIRAVCGPEARIAYLMRNPFERAVSEYFWKRERFGEHRSMEEVFLAPGSQYVATGFYDLQIEAYLRHFDRAQLHLMTFEQYFADQDAGFAALCAWLGIDPMPVAGLGIARGGTDKKMTRTARFAPINRAVQASPALRRAIKAVLPHRTLKKATQALSRPVPREKVPDGLRERMLGEIFAPSVARTEALTGLDLSAWKV